jgi:predicted 3-demethylubiquinone-9 3-methyltransferase (glyoxalase superfamily)
MQKVTPFLWFDGKAEEAAAFYTSIFEDSKIVSTTRYGGAGPGPKGSVMSVTFQLGGQEFIALNGGPHFSFTPALSLFVTCQSQEEVDRYWERFSQGGESQGCGWIKDKYGLSWQIVPAVLQDLLRDEDPAKANRAMQAMLKMTKLDIAALKQAKEA